MGDIQDDDGDRRFLRIDLRSGARAVSSPLLAWWRKSARPIHHTDLKLVGQREWAEIEGNEMAVVRDGRILLPKLSWDKLKAVDDERKYNESLCNQRFTFMLTVFGAVVAAVIAVKTPGPSGCVLLFGGVITWYLSRSVTRTYAKTCFMHAFLTASRYEPLHLVDICFNKDLKVSRHRGSRSLSLVGLIAPNVITYLLFALSVYAFFCDWTQAYWLFPT